MPFTVYQMLAISKVAYHGIAQNAKCWRLGGSEISYWPDVTDVDGSSHDLACQAGRFENEQSLFYAAQITCNWAETSQFVDGWYWKQWADRKTDWENHIRFEGSEEGWDAHVLLPNGFSSIWLSSQLGDPIRIHFWRLRFWSFTPLTARINAYQCIVQVYYYELWVAFPTAMQMH